MKKVIISDAQYLADCNDFFAPLDEIAEALNDGEGLNGLSSIELIFIVDANPDMMERIQKYL